ncbi:MAG: TonB-dependent receptor domain-containing protein [Bryobacteraceae bacterium]
MIRVASVAALLCAAFPAAPQETAQLEAQPAAPAAAPVTPRANLAAAAARRNENVQVNRVDNDALKESNIRLGDNVTIVSQPVVETSYYATEHGRPAAERAVLSSGPVLPGWHGEVYEFHQNSFFNARTFFQAGSVLPSRRNNYGGRFAGPVAGIGNLTGSFSQRKIRGMVNGNVLVPLGFERTPLATDPAVRALVGRFLDSYPAELPNRPDFDQRALNTNSLQRSDETDASLRLDRDLGSKSRLSISHTLGRQRVKAFQLVAGRNPDTEIHSHRSRMTFRREISPGSEVALGAGFTRTKSLLIPEPHAASVRVRVGFQIEELGPDSQFPINRAQNHYRWGAVATRRLSGGAHILTFGADATRAQLNGIETNNSRGFFAFSNNFGRTAIENLRLGAPSTYEVTIGELSRGFRNSQAAFFLADQWKISPRLQVYYGLRYAMETSPVEVHRLNEIPYGCDCNNFSPRFSIAWRLKTDRVIRAGYTVSFGQILPVTFQQVRYNPPLVRYIQVQNPDLLNPLRGIDLNDPNARAAPVVLSPDMVSPYAHQYQFSVEDRLPGRWFLRAGYAGSRSFKLLNAYVTNRAQDVPGIPLTLDTVDRRRADPRYYDVNGIVNGGIAYLDAGQVSLEGPSWRGLVWGASYTFGKAIDEGVDYASTAANRDLNRARSQSQFDSAKDKKGLSFFDSTHSTLFYYSFAIPAIRSSHTAWKWLIRDWQVAGSSLLKSGTPLTLYIGSDAPGFGNVDGGPSDRPNILDASILGKMIGDPNTAAQIIRRDRFGYITPGETRGNLGRGTFRKGGIANFNAAVTRQWRWGAGTERAVLFRVEASNLTNHPQFDEPQRNLTSPAFGKITNTLNDGRVLQFGIRFLL